MAATGRSLVQLGTDAARAPLAYSLSLVAAVIYLVATTCLLLGGRRPGGWPRLRARSSWSGCSSVGALSLVATDLFPDKTVWSHFGQGYGFLPLVLPFAGLAWLRPPSSAPLRPSLRLALLEPPEVLTAH